MTAWSRRHCACVQVENLTYEQAAEALKIKADWLRDNIGRLPHQKFGKNPAVFCHCDLRLIQAMQTVMPADAEAVLDAPLGRTTTPTPAAPHVRALSELTPSQGRRRRVAAQT